MTAILENIKALGPGVIICWILLIFCTLQKPQRYFNCILLMITCFLTLFFIAGLFGSEMGTALITAFLLIMLIIFLVPAMLIVNGIHLIRKESFSFAHLLSLLLGLFIGIGEIATVLYLFGISFREIPKLPLAISLTAIYFSCIILSFVMYSVFIQIIPHRQKFDYVIVHGCGLSNGEKVTKLLANRIDTAISTYNRCEKKPMLIASGGQGDDEKLSEAQAISNYLTAHGLPEDHILLEDKSATTMENLAFSQRIIDSRDGGKRIALVSSNYHIYRCLTYAKELGMKCCGIGAPVALYYWPTALLREFVAVFKQKKFIIWTLLGYFIIMYPLLHAML